MGESSGETMRFKLFNDDELEDFIESASSDNTKKQIKYSLAILNFNNSTIFELLGSIVKVAVNMGFMDTQIKIQDADKMVKFQLLLNFFQPINKQ